MVAFSRKNSFATTVRFFEEYGLIYTFRSNEKLKANHIKEFYNNCKVAFILIIIKKISNTQYYSFTDS